MQFDLNPVEVRVLGTLIEKALTTPEYYPLTLNSLANACNQKSNRDPVTNLDEKELVRALDSLRQRKLVGLVSFAGARVPKYEHCLNKVLTLPAEEIAVLVELMVRGPQTPGELKARAERMCPFAGREEVEATLHRLQSLGDPLVVCLPRQPGRKESRFAHLFGGPIDVNDASLYPTAASSTGGAVMSSSDGSSSTGSSSVPAEPARRAVEAENQRLATVEAELAALRDDMAALRAQFAEFRKQFE